MDTVANQQTPDTNTTNPGQLQVEATPSSAAGAIGASSVQNTVASQEAQAPSAMTGDQLSSGQAIVNSPSTGGYQTVDQAYNQLVNQNSPMMQQAAATAQRQAARRGLGNSSMATGMAQAAQAQAAIPLAQQMASQSQNQSQYDRSQTETERGNLVKEDQGQQGITNQKEQAERAQTEAERAAQAGEGLKQQEISNQDKQFAQSLEEQIRSGKVSESQAQQQINNQADQFAKNLAEQIRSGKVSEAQAQEQIKNQASQFTDSLKQQQYEFQANLGLENSKLRQDAAQFAKSIQANARGSYTDSVNNLLNNSSVNINNISSNANLPQSAKDKLIAQEIANRNNDLKYLQNLYGSTTSWADKL